MRINRIIRVCVAATVLGSLGSYVSLLSGCGGATGTQSAVLATTTTLSGSSSPASTTAVGSASMTSATGAANSPGVTGTARTVGTPATRGANMTATRSASSTIASGTAAHTHSAHAASPTQPRPTHVRRLAVLSAAFPREGRIPAQYTCDGANNSPPVRWGAVPAGTTQMLVLALSLSGGARHAIRWAVGGLDPTSGGFAAGQLPPGAMVGRNSEGHTGWADLCPTRGTVQSVVLLVYALRHKLGLASGFEVSSVQSQLAADTLASGVVYGTYIRP